MNKRFTAMLLAVLMLFSLCACGDKNEGEISEESSPVSQEEISREPDWRESGNFLKAQSVVGSRVTDFLLSLSDDRALIYYDDEKEKLYGTAIFPRDLNDREFTRYQIELKDLNNDGNADLDAPYLEADGETVGHWYYLWDSSINDFVHDSEFTPEVKEESSEAESSDEESNENPEESSEESSEPEKKKVTLYLNKNQEIFPLEVEYEGEFGPGDAVNAIAEETWLNFSLIYQPMGEDIYIYWSEESALHNAPTSLNPKYGLADDDSLRWFMLDSLSSTFKEMGYSNVYFMGENGGDLVLSRTEKVTVIDSSKPYGGSAAASTGISTAEQAKLVLMRSFVGLGDEGVSLSLLKEGSAEGEHCYIFTVTDNTEGGMTGEAFFAVADSGKVYAYDPSGDTYIPY